MCIYILALISRNLKTPYFNNKQFADLVQKNKKYDFISRNILQEKQEYSIMLYRDNYIRREVHEGHKTIFIKCL